MKQQHGEYVFKKGYLVAAVVRPAPATVPCPQCGTALNNHVGFRSCPKCEHCEEMK